MKWSFQALYDGVHPMADDLGRAWPADSPQAAKAGKSLANGMRGILYYITGDLEHYGKSLGLPSYRCGNPCFACPCDRRDTPWFELRKAQALWTHHVYVFATALAGLCALFDLAFVSIVSVCPDWLHNKKLGTDAYFYGSVLWLLVYEIFPAGTTAATAMAQVNEELAAAYREFDVVVRFQNISLSSIDVTTYTIFLERLVFCISSQCATKSDLLHLSDVRHVHRPKASK